MGIFRFNALCIKTMTLGLAFAPFHFLITIHWGVTMNKLQFAGISTIINFCIAPLRTIIWR